jgi:hypothetical protein
MSERHLFRHHLPPYLKIWDHTPFERNENGGKITIYIYRHPAEERAAKPSLREAFTLISQIGESSSIIAIQIFKFKIVQHRTDFILLIIK